VWVGQITPVVHYCMGGVKINERTQVGGVGRGGGRCV
jgi:succinate dehydrogenase/fumarate reductase flavoprotein subunit